MKKSLLLLAVLAIVFVGCKDPDDPNEPKEPQVTPKWCSTQVEKKHAILEEFTGQGCGYCPDGHKIANQIAKDNPGRFFPINIHAGGYARQEMLCADATTIHNGFVVRGYPMGMVNRNDAGVVNRGSWYGYVQAELQKDACVNMVAKASLNEANRELKVTVEMYYTADAPTPTNYLTVEILVDNIMAAQSNGKLYNPEYWDDTANLYRHMHVLAGCVSTPWGEEITTTKKGSLVTKEFTYTIPEKLGTHDIVLDDVIVLAFACEDQKYNVLNACEAEITK